VVSGADEHVALEKLLAHYPYAGRIGRAVAGAPGIRR
jgi:hypothetical protein